jgi:hypothetical protein
VDWKGEKSETGKSITSCDLGAALNLFAQYLMVKENKHGVPTFIFPLFLEEMSKKMVKISFVECGSCPVALRPFEVQVPFGEELPGMWLVLEAWANLGKAGPDPAFSGP